MFTMIKSVRRPTEFVPAVLVCALCLFVPAAVEAQARATPATETQGGFPDASFETAFRKYTPPKHDYSPFYSWDAHMVLGLTVFRKGRAAVQFEGLF